MYTQCTVCRGYSHFGKPTTFLVTILNHLYFLTQLNDKEIKEVDLLQYISSSSSNCGPQKFPQTLNYTCVLLVLRDIYQRKWGGLDVHQNLQYIWAKLFNITIPIWYGKNLNEQYFIFKYQFIFFVHPYGYNISLVTIQVKWRRRGCWWVC